MCVWTCVCVFVYVLVHFHVMCLCVCSFIFFLLLLPLFDSLYIASHIPYLFQCTCPSFIALLHQPSTGWHFLSLLYNSPTSLLCLNLIPSIATHSRAQSLSLLVAPFCLTHHHRVVPVVLFCVWCCLPFINNPDQLITPELRAHLLVAPFVWFTPSLYSPSHTWLVYTSVCLLLIGAFPLPYNSCLVVTCPVAV